MTDPNIVLSKSMLAAHARNSWNCDGESFAQAGAGASPAQLWAGGYILCMIGNIICAQAAISALAMPWQKKQQGAVVRHGKVNGWNDAMSN